MTAPSIAPAWSAPQASGISLSPTSIVFGEIEIDTISNPTLITLTNNNTVSISSITIQAPPGFTLSTNGCTGAVPPNGMCTFDIAFSPTGAISNGTGPYSGSVAVTSSGGGGSVAVSGFATDPAASASLANRHCPSGLPGLTNSSSRTCYTLTVTGNLADNLGNENVSVVVDNPPTGTSVLGTILFTGGGGGIQYYQGITSAQQCNGQTCSYATLNNLLADGYITAQTSFACPVGATCPSTACAQQQNCNNSATGWLTYTVGSGTKTFPDGPRVLASRYAAVVQWVHDNILQNGTAYCATANSGGAAALVYGLSHFGLDQVLNFAEPTSGPPLARLDAGCLGGGPTRTNCANQQLTELLDSCAQICVVDPAFNPSNYNNQAACSMKAASAQILHEDSIDSLTPAGVSDAWLTYGISIRLLLGDLDTTDAAVTQGIEWYLNASVNSSNPNVGKTRLCVANAGHELPGYPAGEMQIVSDMTNIPTQQAPYGCRLPTGDAFSRGLQNSVPRLAMTDGGTRNNFSSSARREAQR